MKTMMSSTARPALVIGLAMVVVAACSSGPSQPAASTDPAVPTTAASIDPGEAKAVMAVVRKVVADDHLKAAIVRVTVDGKEIVTGAVGTSMTGVPATPDMHFRNGAVAISYVANLFLQLVDDGTVRLDQKVSSLLPDIPNADRVTLGQLASMTSGYHDYVGDPAFDAANARDPFRHWTPQELIAIGTAAPLWYEPGTNWNYSHTNYLILGLALEKATGQRMTDLMQKRVLGPMGLSNTTDPGNAQIQSPVLHSFSSQRRDPLMIPRGEPFYEETTFWDPSWTITRGAVQTTNIYDLDKTAIAIGTGKLLSAKSHQAMVSTAQRNFGGPVDGCASCRRGSLTYTYGIGLVIAGGWLFQNPTFGGYSAVEAYLPSKKVAISVAVTYGEQAFDETGDVPNRADELFRAIATELAPEDAPPASG